MTLTELKAIVDLAYSDSLQKNETVTIVVQDQKNYLVLHDLDKVERIEQYNGKGLFRPVLNFIAITSYIPDTIERRNDG
jgi:hypothetical protein